MKFKVIDFNTRDVTFVSFPCFLPPMDLTGLIYRCRDKAFKILRVEFDAIQVSQADKANQGYNADEMNAHIPTLYVTEIPTI